MTTRFRPWLFWPVVLLALLVLVGWVRGRYYLDKLFVNKETYWLEFGSGDGVWFQSSPWVHDIPPKDLVFETGSYPRNNLYRILLGTRTTHGVVAPDAGWGGFFMTWSTHTDANGVTTRHRYVEVPYWFLALVMALPTAWVTRSAWRHVRSRHRAGFCAGCGYDLRASSDRCPECGRLISGGPVPGTGEAPPANPAPPADADPAPACGREAPVAD